MPAPAKKNGSTEGRLSQQRMLQRLTELKANIISTSYTYCMGSLEGNLDLYEYDGADPLRYLARLQNFSVCPMGMDLRSRAMRESIGRNAIDGAIFASNRSCKVYSVLQMDQQKRISEELGIPSAMIDFDHADDRKYSEAGTFLRIEALLENIERRRMNLS